MPAPGAWRGRKSNREPGLAIPGDLIDTALGLPPTNGGTVLAQPTAASLLRLFHLIPVIVYVLGGTALHANNDDVLLQEVLAGPNGDTAVQFLWGWSNFKKGKTAGAACR